MTNNKPSQNHGTTKSKTEKFGFLDSLFNNASLDKTHEALNKLQVKISEEKLKDSINQNLGKTFEEKAMGEIKKEFFKDLEELKIPKEEYDKHWLKVQVSIELQIQELRQNAVSESPESKKLDDFIKSIEKKAGLTSTIETMEDKNPFSKIMKFLKKFGASSIFGGAMINKIEKERDPKTGELSMKGGIMKAFHDLFSKKDKKKEKEKKVATKNKEKKEASKLSPDSQAIASLFKKNHIKLQKSYLDADVQWLKNKHQLDRGNIENIVKGNVTRLAELREKLLGDKKTEGLPTIRLKHLYFIKVATDEQWKTILESLKSAANDSAKQVLLSDAAIGKHPEKKKEEKDDSDKADKPSKKA